MSGWGWDFPPGHPTGIDRRTATCTCPHCGADLELGMETEREVNATTLFINGEESGGDCPECGVGIEQTINAADWEYA